MTVPSQGHYGYLIQPTISLEMTVPSQGHYGYLIQPTISLEMPVPSQGHYVFTVFRLLTDFVCLYNYEF
jgi:hypothetical protein